MLEKVKAEWEKWVRLTPNSALYDRSLIWLFISLLAIGFIAVTSASMPLSAGAKYNDPFYFSLRSGGYALLAIIVFLVCVQFSSEQLEHYSPRLLIFTFILLIIVLIVGRDINGAMRWISIGSLNFQPAELAKFTAICYFSRFYVRKFDEMLACKYGFWRPLLILAVFGALLILQPDFGSIVVIFCLSASIPFIMGAPVLQFILTALLGTIAVTIAIYTSEYRMKRVAIFMDPFSDPFGDGHQLTNAQMAFGQGELWGRGLGNSIQKLEYLSEAHTDFVMAVIGEEFGFVGICFIVLLLCALTFKALKISREARALNAKFKGFCAFGIGLLIFMQGFVNLGMASGLLPTKGLTFPLISYGGSSLLTMAAAIAVLVRIDHENRLERLGQVYSKEED